MRRIIIQIYFLVSTTILTSQTAADPLNINSIQPEQAVEQITIKKLYSDSLTTSFIIWVKTEVPLHKHAWHTEQVLVLEGEAKMLVGDTIYFIKPGDMVYVPENTPHQVTVTSAIPLKVLSIQTPEFTGTDRILLEE